MFLPGWLRDDWGSPGPVVTLLPLCCAGQGFRYLRVTASDFRQPVLVPLGVGPRRCRRSTWGALASGDGRRTHPASSSLGWERTPPSLAPVRSQTPPVLGPPAHAAIQPPHLGLA